MIILLLMCIHFSALPNYFFIAETKYQRPKVEGGKVYFCSQSAVPTGLAPRQGSCRAGSRQQAVGSRHQAAAAAAAAASSLLALHPQHLHAGGAWGFHTHTQHYANSSQYANALATTLSISITQPRSYQLQRAPLSMSG